MASSENKSEFRIEDNVLKGKKVTYPDDCTSLGKFVLESLEKDPAFVGQIDAITGEEYTYGRMRDRSVRCALWMRSQGLLPGDVIAICSDNHLDFAMPCFAALYLGVIFTPWDATTDEDMILDWLNIIKPKIMFAGKVVAALIAEVTKKANFNMRIITFGRAPGFLDFDIAIAKPSIDVVRTFDCVELKSSTEIASILFSSGTTGPAKGIGLSHAALTAQLRQSTRPLGMAKNVCLSFTHIGWVSFYRSMFLHVSLQLTALIFTQSDPQGMCAMIEKHKVSWVHLTPFMIDSLIKSDALSKYDLSSVTRIVYSGNRLSVVSHKALAEHLPGVQILSAYGLTEVCGLVSVQTPRSPLGSCGKILENSQLKIIHLDGGQTLGPNQEGELLLRTPSMMSFYYGSQRTLTQIVDDEGWLHTGDYGYYDEDGEIFMIDRIKDLMMVQGERVSALEIERLISSQPGVRDVAVMGLPDCDQKDDLVTAFIVRSKNSPEDVQRQITEAEIVSLVAAELPVTRQLRGGVRFVELILKTRSYKIRRTALREMASSTMLNRRV